MPGDPPGAEVDSPLWLVAVRFAFVIAAGLWAFLGQASLILGAVLVIRWQLSPRVLGLITGFGGGALVAAAAFELTVPAFSTAGGPVTALGIALGSLTFYGLFKRVTRSEEQHEGGGVGIALGALLDGIPESVAIAIAMIGGAAGANGPMVVAVLISNLPEGMASSDAFLRTGWSKRKVLGLWFAIAAIGGVAAAVAFQVLATASPEILGGVQAFAAGTILTMLAAVMMPTAYAQAKESVGLTFVLGFAAIAYLTSLGA